MIQPYDDAYFMKQAYKEAELAFERDEVPVGAVIVHQQTIIARSSNQVEQLTDVTAHAEILTITAAANAIGGKFLDQCTMYVTLEPCVMCAGALYWARIGRLVYGAEDDKCGFMQYGKALLHPSTEVAYGYMREECAALLRQFFKSKR